MVFEGVPLSFVETKKRTKQFSDVGVKQFINLYRRWKDRDNDPFKWGDEVKSYLYQLVSLVYYILTLQFQLDGIYVCQIRQ